MIAHRPFASYDEYVWQQGVKARDQARAAALIARLPKSTVGFERTFRVAAPFLNPGPMLCLGARTGAEVIAASQAGFPNSVGIDLHPIGPEIVRGDWHALPFRAASFPNVYTNSLDHCLWLGRLMAEIRHVLTAEGVFFLMASDRGPKTIETWLANATSTEALYWQESDELCAAVEEYGFACVRSWRAKVWGHYVLRVRRP